MSAHTPTPWRVIAGDDYYITADGYPSEFIGHFKGDDMGPYLALVGNRPKDFGEANAALIVRAVNRDHHFDALVKALEMIEDLADRDESPAYKWGAALAIATGALITAEAPIARDVGSPLEPGDKS